MSIRPIAVLSSLAAFACVSLSAAQPYLVKPINLLTRPLALPTTVIGATPSAVYFAGKNSRWELWSSDGTPEKSRKVTDLPDGVEVDVDATGVAAGTRFIFTATDSEHGREPWVTDGTSDGTHLLMDIVSGSAGSDFKPLRSTGAIAWFSAVNANQVRELWRSDGTAEGTRRITAISGDATILGAGGNRVIASTATSVVSIADDGTVTSLVNHPATSATTLHDRVIFTTFSAITDGALYSTDGTTEGTKILRDKMSNLGGSAPSLATDGDYVWFAAADGTSAEELWRSDGTASGTAIFLDETSRAPGGTHPQNITVAGGKVFFFGQFGVDHDLFVVGPGKAITSVRRATTVNGPAHAAGDRLLFPVCGTSCTMWSSNGTVTGTAQLMSSPIPTNVVFVNGHAIFSMTDATHGREAWTSDGTVAGTKLLANIGFDPTAGSQPHALTPFGDNRILFSAYDGDHFGLWITDGTERHTTQLARIPYYIDKSVVSNGIFYFVTLGSTQLWRSDGTAAGTFLLGSAVLQISNLIPFHKGVAAAGYGMLISDGTVAGTYLTSLQGETRGGLATFGDYVYFNLNQSVGRTNGTPAGTQIFAAPTSTNPAYLLGDMIVNGGSIYAVGQRGLWRIDPEHLTMEYAAIFSDGGSGSGLTTFKDGFLAYAGQYVTTFNLASLAPIRSTNPPNGPILATAGADKLWWVSTSRIRYADGGYGGTGVFDLPGEAAEGYGSVPSVWIDGHLWFAHDDSIHGNELWMNDGTSHGSHLVADVNPGAASSSPRELVQSGSMVYFIAHNEMFGDEVWALPLSAMRHRVAR